MLTLEYRHKNKEKAKAFMENLKNKLDLENTNKNIEIQFVPNPSKRHNQFYYKIIIK
ncbi:hypothetical protein HOF65_04260 [bacterium]|jgi:hypothetical protein|nr:hypothetical protein [bacterium]MBT3853179.1 hypothetical protein [bacterium]MBT4633719.1 hypothetical protein [bacterium]MBT5491253.1 hypothetical protein [bacterium]MBT6779415.1 hypothetical protein [bacterium]